jgi:NADPH:quinone reductase-like Zn-dependent oxidoreductase
MPKAFGFKGYGGPEVQAFLEVPKPAPGPGELLVAVRAAGVNPADWKFRSGFMREVFPLELPAVFGYEVAGVVEAAGPDVDGFAVGDEVFGSVMGGGYAEYAVVPVQMVARKPSEVSFTDAAALPVAAATAFDGLTQLGLAAGQTLLIVGVGGGVGVAAAQIARNWGIRVVGTASAAKREFVEPLGVTHVAYGDGVADRVRAAAPDGVDGLFDLVGGDALRAVGDLVADPKRLVTAVDPGAAGEFGGHMIERSSDSHVLEAVAGLAASGDLKPFVTAVFPLDQAAEALSAVETGHAEGKIVIRVS